MAKQYESIVYIDPHDTTKTAQAIKLEILNSQETAVLVNIVAKSENALIFTWERK